MLSEQMILEKIDRAVAVYQEKRDRGEDVTAALMDLEQAMYELVS